MLIRYERKYLHLNVENLKNHDRIVLVFIRDGSSKACTTEKSSEEDLLRQCNREYYSSLGVARLKIPLSETTE